jgi:5-methylcytosine-specific restriction endonuclease McrA
MTARNATALDLRTLKLNADYMPVSMHPLSVVPAREAVEAVLSGDADVVEAWPVSFFRSPSLVLETPKVIVLRRYVQIHAGPKFCRRSVYLRDRYRCQYCGDPFPTEELTYDHVIPRAKGGETVWENILTCCVTCNARKRDHSANWSGRRASGAMRPLKTPRQPTAAELMRAGLEFVDESHKMDFGSYLYWNAELKA